MKTSIIIFLLAITSVSFAGERACLKKLKTIEPIEGAPLKHKMLCKRSTFRTAMDKRFEEFKTCLNNSSSIHDAFLNIYILCANHNFRQKAAKERYVSCIENLLYYGVEKNFDNTCIRKSNRTTVLSNNFSYCMETTKKLGGPESFNLCMKKMPRDFVNSMNYETCMEDKKGVSHNQAIRECTQTQKIDSIVESDIQECQNEILGLRISKKICNKQSVRNVRDKRACFKELASFSNLKILRKHDFDDVVEEASKDCNKKRKKKFSNGKVKFINSQYFYTDTRLYNYEVGGLSAVSMGLKNNEIFLVSDDQGIHGPSRVIRSSIKFEEDAFRIELLENIPFRRYNLLDAEGFQVDKDGSFIVSSETLSKKSSTLLRRFDSNGKFINRITTPKNYLKEFEQIKVKKVASSDRKIGPNFSLELNRSPFEKEKNVKKQTKGVTENKGFEAISLSLDKNFLYTANESLLVQDKNFLRISKLKKKGRDYDVLAEYKYPVSEGEETGLVELLEIEENQLLALERKYDYIKDKVTAIIYKLDLNKVSKKNFVKKELYLNLDDVLDSLPFGLRRIDNLEGMGFGPNLPNGNRSLILVSDNNFSFKQRTQIIFLELL